MDWKQIIIDLTTYAWPALAPVLAVWVTGVATAMIMAIARRLQIKTDQETEQRLRDTASKAVLAAEEIVESWLKANKGAVADKGTKKVALAAEIIKRDYPELDAQRMSDEIHAALAAGAGLGATDKAKG